MRNFHRRLGACAVASALISAWLAPPTVQAGARIEKSVERVPAIEAPVAASLAPALPPVEAGPPPCDARPWRSAGETCLRPAVGDEPARIVRIVTIERRVGEATSVLERRAVLD